ncbi:hypothetical protein [Bacillus sp. FJAT-45066]|uniref:hypothetical protein n=1 Tax=Bacillus sp. FJAT-45066 TaxID=2011010 RepID=UPI000BB869B3|nr:hypothetical protein [Bacillus sp. FJAT-45066]
MKISRVLLSIGVTIIAIFIFLGYLFFVEGQYVSTNTIGVQEIEVSEEEIFIKGISSDSGNGFSKHTYFLEDENLYIKLKYSIVSIFNPAGDFNIIITQPTNEIKKIYIQGNKKDDKRLVWGKQ